MGTVTLIAMNSTAPRRTLDRPPVREGCDGCKLLVDGEHQLYQSPDGSNQKYCWRCLETFYNGLRFAKERYKANQELLIATMWKADQALCKSRMLTGFVAWKLYCILEKNIAVSEQLD